MKLPDKLKPQFCCSKDPTRYILNYGCYRDGMIFATNGKMMVAATTEEDDWKEDVSDEALIPVNALKVASKHRKSAWRALDGVVTILEDNVVRVHDSLDERRLIKTCKDVYKFPNIGKVTPTDLAELTTISFDAKMLWELAQALGTEGVCLHFKDGGKGGIMVQPIKFKDRIGLIMPMYGDSAENLYDNKALNKLLAMREASKQNETLTDS
jgi:hypothetical protein